MSTLSAAKGPDGTYQIRLPVAEIERGAAFLDGVLLKGGGVLRQRRGLLPVGSSRFRFRRGQGQGRSGESRGAQVADGSRGRRNDLRPEGGVRHRGGRSRRLVRESLLAQQRTGTDEACRQAEEGHCAPKKDRGASEAGSFSEEVGSAPDEVISTEASVPVISRLRHSARRHAAQ